MFGLPSPLHSGANLIEFSRNARGKIKKCHFVYFLKKGIDNITKSVYYVGEVIMDKAVYIVWENEIMWIDGVKKRTPPQEVLDAICLHYSLFPRQLKSKTAFGYYLKGEKKFIEDTKYMMESSRL